MTSASDTKMGLKGCPFCGGEVEIAVTLNKDYYIGHTCFSSNCLRLYFNDGYQSSGTIDDFESEKQRTIAAWNTRAI